MSDNYLLPVSYKDVDVLDFELDMVLPEFTKNVQDNASNRAKFISNEDLELFERSFEILFYVNGCSFENKGFVSTLFRENRECPLSSEFISFTFSCILSIIDNSGKSRFPQSFAVMRCAGIDEANKTKPYAPFGLERFIDCKTIMNSFEEFITDDKLTFSLVISVDLHYKVDSNHSINIYLNMKCDDDIEPIESPDGTTTYKLSFERPLFMYLKNLSLYFRKIAIAPMSEASSQSMFIPEDEYEAFRKIAVYVSTGSMRHITNFDELVQVYVIADKYQLLKLKQSCSERLKNEVSHQNALDILVIANTLNDKILMTSVIRYIRTFLPEIMYTDEWNRSVSLQKDLIDEILGSTEVIEKDLSVSTNVSSDVSTYEEQQCCNQLEESYFN